MSATPKPFASSCEQNQQVILETIRPLLTDRKTVLEVASGTGQHAVYLAKQMPHLTWQTSDLIEVHTGINQWIEEADLNNVYPPLALNVSTDCWPTTNYDAVFSANSFHIMSLQNVTDFFSHITKVLKTHAILIIYGPFNYHGQYTSESNARFDSWLKQNNPKSGIKDFEWCNQLANQAGLKLTDDLTMPSNNRILCWQKPATIE